MDHLSSMGTYAHGKEEEPSEMTDTRFFITSGKLGFIIFNLTKKVRNRHFLYPQCQEAA